MFLILYLSDNYFEINPRLGNAIIHRKSANLQWVPKISKINRALVIKQKKKKKKKYID